MSSIKEEVTSLLDRLPDDASNEDVQYHLYVGEKVRHGLEAARAEEFSPNSKPRRSLENGAWPFGLNLTIPKYTQTSAVPQSKHPIRR